MTIRRYTFLGCGVDAVNENRALQEIRSLVTAKSPASVLFLNTDVIVKASSNTKLHKAISEAALSLMDGQPPFLLARALRVPLPSKISGSDFVPAVCGLAANEGYSVYLLGGKAGVPQKAAQQLRIQHPKIKIAGEYSPPMGFEASPNEVAKVVEVVSEAHPDILLVFFGCPKQEIFVMEHMHEYNVPLSISAGATVDFIAGTSTRAPRWISRVGFEWLFRFFKEPRRLFRRYFIDSWKLLYLLVRHRVDGQP